MSGCSTHRCKATKRKYPLQKEIFVDVDGTLFIGGCLNIVLINFLKSKKEEGFLLVLWSARGREYAELAAEKSGYRYLFTDVISKPGVIVDDVGWGWINFTLVMSPFIEDPEL